MLKRPHKHCRNQSGNHTRIVSAICILLMIGALLFLLYYHVIQPALSNQATDKYREIYHSSLLDTEAASEVSKEVNAPDVTEPPSESLIADGNTIAKLQKYNPDIMGWITVPGTNIDYPVVQALDSERQSYYLTHNIDGKEDKNGSLLIDYRTPLTDSSRNIVINGHNMKSTGLMFRELINYNELDFYRKNPVITFNTATSDSQWKIFALIKTNNNEKHGPLFTYYRDDFTSDNDFLEFVYQLELRSIYSYPVTVNEHDTLLILSTCTYEMDDMRLLIVARRLRPGEDAVVDTDRACEKECILYPDAWYDLYTATRPEISSFTDAYNTGSLSWYDGN